MHKESLASWCKMLDDIAKVAILAVPVILYESYPLDAKIIRCSFLVVGAYFCLLGSDLLRRNKINLIKEWIMALTVGLGIMAAMSILMVFAIQRAVKNSQQGK